MSAVDNKRALGGEPALVIGALISAILAVLSAYGVVLDEDLTEALVISAGPLLAGILTRFNVVPVTKR